jgi:hypothetical protein
MQADCLRHEDVIERCTPARAYPSAVHHSRYAVLGRQACTAGRAQELIQRKAVQIELGGSMRTGGRGASTPDGGSTPKLHV